MVSSKCELITIMVYSISLNRKHILICLVNENVFF